MRNSQTPPSKIGRTGYEQVTGVQDLYQNNAKITEEELP
jgi:hypothetical protein